MNKTMSEDKSNVQSTELDIDSFYNTLFDNNVDPSYDSMIREIKDTGVNVMLPREKQLNIPDVMGRGVGGGRVGGNGGNGGSNSGKIEIGELKVVAARIDETNNILNDDVIEKLKKGIDIPDTIYFTKAVSTTITLSGILTNVAFNERDFIRVARPTEKVPSTECNYGVVSHPSFVPQVKVKNSNRGRKQKNPIVNKRKKQGTGNCFNSQVTFYVTKDKQKEVLKNSPYHKIKVFRPGKFQLPGAKPEKLVEIIKKVDDVIDVLQNCLPLMRGLISWEKQQQDKLKEEKVVDVVDVVDNLVVDVVEDVDELTDTVEVDEVSEDELVDAEDELMDEGEPIYVAETVPDDKTITVLSISPCMKNYKFEIGLCEGEILNLHVMKLLLIYVKYVESRLEVGEDLQSAIASFVPERILPADYKYGVDSLPDFNDWVNDELGGKGEMKGYEPHPSIYDIKYTRNDTMLCIKFNTPTPNNRNKRTRVNIFPGGKVNIIGGLDEVITGQIYKFLHEFYVRYIHYLCVQTNMDSLDDYVYVDFVDNIALIDRRDEMEALIAEMINVDAEMPEPDISAIVAIADEAAQTTIESHNLVIADYMNSVLIN